MAKIALCVCIMLVVMMSAFAAPTSPYSKSAGDYGEIYNGQYNHNHHNDHKGPHPTGCPCPDCQGGGRH